MYLEIQNILWAWLFILQYNTFFPSFLVKMLCTSVHTSCLSFVMQAKNEAANWISLSNDGCRIILCVAGFFMGILSLKYRFPQTLLVCRAALMYDVTLSVLHWLKNTSLIFHYSWIKCESFYPASRCICLLSWHCRVSWKSCCCYGMAFCLPGISPIFSFLLVVVTVDIVALQKSIFQHIAYMLEF